MFFWTLSLLVRIFTIIYDILQYYYDNWRSFESWSSLLTPPLAENNGGTCALRRSVEKYNEVLKDMEVGECLVVSSHVPILQHRAKHVYITRKRLFVCLFREAAGRDVFGLYSGV